MTPNKTQVRHLKALCHSLKPVVRIGQKGVTDALLAELEIALAHHELIKIKIVADRDERQAISERLTTHCNAVVIQQIGQVLVLFRRNHEQPVIHFPK